MRGDKQGATLAPLPTWPVAPMTRILGLLFGIVGVALGDVRSSWRDSWGTVSSVERRRR